ncbi:MAG: F0F1 ATP synthase subunit B [Acidobacteriota bacterium]
MLIQPEPGLAIWTILTFLLLVFVLGKFAWKPILAILHEREQSIRQALDESRRARDEAESLMEQNRTILADAQNRANELLEQARREAEARRAELVEKTRQDAEALMARSREEIERQQRAAIKEIRGEVADLAMGAAARVVGQSLDGEQHRRLIDEYFASLSGDPEQAS